MDWHNGRRGLRRRNLGRTSDVTDRRADQPAFRRIAMARVTAGEEIHTFPETVPAAMHLTVFSDRPTRR